MIWRKKTEREAQSNKSAISSWRNPQRNLSSLIQQNSNPLTFFHFHISNSDRQHYSKLLQYFIINNIVKMHKGNNILKFAQRQIIIAVKSQCETGTRYKTDFCKSSSFPIFYIQHLNAESLITHWMCLVFRC